ncbi:hypothetical protein [Floridanema evergladense]|uniref:Uncharacterized protein n=1 Tax=Floridaenema evergladense BLCC-F167 TaxID=3153639 RepID=A0ABV4WTY0_9CYAN
MELRVGRSLGLFEVEPRKFSDKRFPTVYFNVKIADLLIIAEAIEALLCDSAYSKKEVSRSFTLSRTTTAQRVWHGCHV